MLLFCYLLRRLFCHVFHSHTSLNGYFYMTACRFRQALAPWHSIRITRCGQKFQDQVTNSLNLLMGMYYVAICIRKKVTTDQDIPVTRAAKNLTRILLLLCCLLRQICCHIFHSHTSLNGYFSRTACIF